MTDLKMMCSVYRSPKKDGMYLYVPKDEPFENVPEDLLQRFGVPGHVMDLLLTHDRKLARVDVKEVIESMTGKGYFLQMPPAESIGF